jgi:DNA polymerase-3 subunit delta'
LLDSADRLGSGAANSILKIVEEPPRNSVIILLAHEGAVLPTIRSRCQRVYFRPLNKAEMAQVLEQSLPDLSAEDRAILTEISEGSPGTALEIYENKGLEVVKDLADILANPQKANYDRLAKFAANVSKSDKSWRAYKLIVSWIINKLARTSLYGLPLQLGASQIKPKDALRLAGLDADLHNKIEECEVFNMDKKVLIVNSLSDILRAPAAAIQ